MRRLMLLTAGVALTLFTAVAPAAADNGPHNEGAGPVADSCASCHRVHTADAPHLLKETQTSLCYTCHGASGTGANNDVVSGVGYSEPSRGGTAGALRGGGFQYALIKSSEPSGYRESGTIPVKASGGAVTSTHSVDESAQTAWGFGAIDGGVDYGKTVKLSCGNCHDPHGNGQYRILRETPRELWSHGEEKEGKAAHVEIPDPATKVYTTTNYWKADDANEPGFIENIATWCSTCHTRYLASYQGSTYSGDPVFSYRHTSGKTGSSGNQRNCIQCHVAHGSNAGMGAKSNSVPFPDGSSGAGDSRLLRADNRGVCQLCHAK